ncbi:MAG: peptidoglycan-N-acetylglucosamine deacetylase [Actinomycetota bacterium]|nr:peptidoglycan-N-acetylglucosamine deacetylase [Actinomycetota bacterium]
MRIESLQRLAVCLAVACVAALASSSPLRAAELSVTITAPAAGARLSHRSTLVAQTTGNFSAVRFMWSKKGTTWSPIDTDRTKGDRWSVSWKLPAYVGRALVRAVAIRASTRIHDTAAVRIDNPPLTIRSSRHAVSPNGDGRKDTTTIRVRSLKGAHLVTKLLRRGRVLRVWRTKGWVRRQTILWRGKVSGSTLRDHHYKFKAVATRRTGTKLRASTSVVIDTKPPRATLDGLPRRPVSGLDPISFSYWSWDRSHRVKVGVEVSDAIGRTDFRSFSRRRGQAAVSFRPKTPRGRSLPPGLYTARMIITDDAANSATTQQRILRIVRPVHPKVFTSVPASGRRVALSFDDCLDPVAWHRILHVLSKHTVKATFFCPGQEVLRYPALARATVRKGDDVGSHGWDHALLTGSPASATAWRLRKDAGAWWKVAHFTSTPYFRPPYGAYDSNVLRGSEETGYGRIILWNVDPADWQNPAPATIARRVLSHVHPGSIVILHVKRHTAAALPLILRGLAHKHLKPVNMDRLFAAAGLRYFR